MPAMSSSPFMQGFDAVEQAKMNKQRLGLQQQQMAMQQQQMGFNQNMAMQKLALQNSQLQERIREFNQTSKLQNRRLDMGIGTGTGRLPAPMKAMNAANSLAQQAGAITPQGTIDVSKFNPMQRQQYNTLMQYATKQSTDSFTRKQAQLGRNMMLTFNSINPGVLSYYAGTVGKGRLARDSALPAGQQPQVFNQYMETVNTQIPLLVDQITKYLQTSVQPQKSKELANAINLNSWSGNPQIVLQQFSKAKELFGNEFQNTMAAMNNPTFYTTTATQVAMPASPYQASAATGATPSFQAISNARSGAKYTTQQIKAMAAVTGKTIKQVKQELGIS